MTEINKILVGKIVAPQGIRGDVRIQTYTADPMDFATLPVFGAGVACGDFKFVRRLNPTSTVVVAHISGINDRNMAEILRGIELFVNRDDLPATGANEYYQVDLIGFDVVHAGKKIGTVAGFQNFGAGDIIELDNGDLEAFRGALVDMENKTIRI